MRRMSFAMMVMMAALVLAGALTAAQTAPTPRLADGTVDLNGIWGATALPPTVKTGESVRWLLPTNAPTHRPKIVLTSVKLRASSR